MRFAALATRAGLARATLSTGSTTLKDIGDRNVTGLIANVEAAMTRGSGPDWVGQLWYVTTIGPLH